MKRAILFGIGSLVAIIILAFVGVLIYARANLNGLIRQNRAYLLEQASNTLGRNVQAGEITGHLGWGLTVDIQGAQIADDPAFSSRPMLAAQDLYCDVELLPLLRRQVRVKRLLFEKPRVSVVRNRQGVLNISTLGPKPGSSPTKPQGPTAPSPKSVSPAPLNVAPPKKAEAPPSALGALSVGSFSIHNGELLYQDLAGKGAPIAINDIDLDIERFSPSNRFPLQLAIALFGTEQNFRLSGNVGPLMTDGKIDFARVPLDLSIRIGPIVLASIRKIPQVGATIPPELKLPDPVNLDAKVAGTVQAAKFNLNTDLGAARVSYASLLDKAAGVPFKLSLDGARTASSLQVNHADLTLAGLALKARDIAVSQGNYAATIDTNNFELASLTKVFPSLGGYGATGSAEVHTKLRTQTGGKTNADGTLTLNNVGLSGGNGRPLVKALSGRIRTAGNSADLGPLTFELGSAKAQLQAHADSLSPLRASYQLSANSIKPAEFTSGSDPGDEIRQLSINGTAAGSPSSPRVELKAASPSGRVESSDYKNLAADLGWEKPVLNISSFKVDAWKGNVSADGRLTTSQPPGFNLTMNLRDIDLQQVLIAQKSKAADTVRGQITGQARAAGAGREFEGIKQTLKGDGRFSVRDGKLIGVNVVADALGKVQDLPGIGALVPASVVSNHPGLFKQPDTDIKSAALTFTLAGPRITTHDLTVASPDYSVLGDGWFDLDKNIDMGAQIHLSRQLSDEIKAQKKNVAYLTDSNGEVVVPLRLEGKLPKVKVLPDVSQLAQRAATHGIEKKGGELLHKFLGNKIPGGLF